MIIVVTAGEPPSKYSVEIRKMLNNAFMHLCFCHLLSSEPTRALTGRICFPSVVYFFKISDNKFSHLKFLLVHIIAGQKNREITAMIGVMKMQTPFYLRSQIMAGFNT